MDEVRAQYEALPYPPRDPRDEAIRLITGKHPGGVDGNLSEQRRILRLLVIQLGLIGVEIAGGLVVLLRSDRDQPGQ